MCAAHLNYNTARDGKLLLPPPEKMEMLFGCRFTGETISTNSGTKFIRNSEMQEMLYPVSEDIMGDPLFSAGNAVYAKVDIAGAKAVGVLSDSFWEKGNEDALSVIENRVGDGVATLITSVNYPGNNAIYPLYRAMVREHIGASARNADVKVIGSDRVRWAMYEDNKIYLLNTDYDVPAIVEISSGDKKMTVTVNSLELKSVHI